MHRPILSADGTVELSFMPSCVSYRDSARLDVRQVLDGILSMIGVYTLTEFASVKRLKKAEPVEYDYIWSRHGSRLSPSWKEFEAARKPYVGAYLISGNFREISCAFRFITSDRTLASKFIRAMERNPGWPDACRLSEEFALKYQVFVDNYERWKEFRTARNQGVPSEQQKLH